MVGQLKKDRFSAYALFLTTKGVLYIGEHNFVMVTFSVVISSIINCD
jgi:hypothetical protein